MRLTLILLSSSAGVTRTSKSHLPSRPVLLMTGAPETRPTFSSSPAISSLLKFLQANAMGWLGFAGPGVGVGLVFRQLVSPLVSVDFLNLGLSLPSVSTYPGIGR